jgi:hypothetical protein
MVAALSLASLSPDTARAGAATDAMKGTIEEVLRILADKDLKQPAKANERRQLGLALSASVIRMQRNQHSGQGSANKVPGNSRVPGGRLK